MTLRDKGKVVISLQSVIASSLLYFTEINGCSYFKLLSQLRDRCCKVLGPSSTFDVSFAVSPILFGSRDSSSIYWIANQRC